MRNSGSDWSNPGHLLPPLHEVRGLPPIPGALRLVEDHDVVERGVVQLRTPSSRKWWTFWMNGLTFCADGPLRIAVRRSGGRTRRASAPRGGRRPAGRCRTGRRHARIAELSRRVATLRPTSVLPAPGTPVTKTIALRRSPSGTRSMISSTAAEVTLQVARTGVVARDRLDGVPRVERARRLDDRRRRLGTAHRPQAIGVERRAAGLAERLPDRPAQVLGVAAAGGRTPSAWGALPIGVGLRGLGRDEDREDRRARGSPRWKFFRSRP